MGREGRERSILCRNPPFCRSGGTSCTPLTQALLAAPVPSKAIMVPIQPARRHWAAIWHLPESLGVTGGSLSKGSCPLRFSIPACVLTHKATGFNGLRHRSDCPRKGPRKGRCFQGCVESECERACECECVWGHVCTLPYPCLCVCSWTAPSLPHTSLHLVPPAPLPRSPGELSTVHSARLAAGARAQLQQRAELVVSSSIPLPALPLCRETRGP